VLAARWAQQEETNVSGTPLRSVPRSFDVEYDGETVIVTPVAGSSPDWREDQIRTGETARGVLDKAAKNVVVDLRGADSFGSAALGLFLSLWKGVRDRDRRMALCNVSLRDAGMLRTTSLDTVWPIWPTREKALKAIGE
jgi:anti-anti-sigma factor